MDTLTNPHMPYGCDWDGECMVVFATRDELDVHERGHWAAMKSSVITRTLARIEADATEPA